MNTENQFENLWRQQAIGSMPVKETLTEKADAITKKARFDMGMATLLLLISIPVIIGVTAWSQAVTTATFVGTGLSILAIFIFIVSSNSFIQFLFTSASESADSHQYLKRMYYLKSKQLFLQKMVMPGYFILLTLGILLYMTEWLAEASLQRKFLWYGGTMAWVLFNWFYLRRINSKKNAALSALVAQLEKLNVQLKEGLK